MKRRQYDQAGDVETGADDHHRPEPDARGEAAGDRLQQPPSHVLDGDGDGEVGDRRSEVARQRLQEQPQALAQLQADAEHQGDGNQDQSSWNYTGRCTMID